MARVRTLSLVGDGVQKNGKTVTKAMLGDIVKRWSGDGRPPITLGHPAQGADKVAALGRVDNPRTEPSRRVPGKTELVVELHYTPELEKLEDEGKFEGFSAGIYPTVDGKGYYLHHVAALGQLPPAAETETRELVELSSDGMEQMVVLSGVLTFSDSQTEDIEMTKEELAAAMKDVRNKDDQTDDPNKDKKPGEQGKDKPLVDSQARDQLKTMQETVKSDRIAQATELANAKGWGEAEFKPLLTMLQKAEPVELCNNAEDGLYATVKATINARTVTPNKPSPLGQALEFSDDKGNKQQLNLNDVARVSKF